MIMHCYWAHGGFYTTQEYIYAIPKLVTFRDFEMDPNYVWLIYTININALLCNLYIGLKS